MQQPPIVNVMSDIQWQATHIAHGHSHRWRPSQNGCPSSTSCAPSKSPPTSKTPIAAPRTSRLSSVKNANANANADDSRGWSGSGTWPWTSTGPARRLRRKRTSRRVRFCPFRVSIASPSSHRHLDRSTSSHLPPRHYCDITGPEVRIARVVSFCDTHEQARTLIRARGSGTTRAYTISSRTSCVLPSRDQTRRRSLVESRCRKILLLRQTRQSHRQVAPLDPRCSSSRHDDLYGRLVVVCYSPASIMITDASEREPFNPACRTRAGRSDVCMLSSS